MLLVFCCPVFRCLLQFIKYNLQFLLQCLKRAGPYFEHILTIANHLLPMEVLLSSSSQPAKTLPTNMTRHKTYKIQTTSDKSVTKEE